MPGGPSPTPSAGSWVYDSDASGDISLSLPASSSTPRLASLLNPEFSVAQATSNFGRTRSLRDNNSAAPPKLFGRNLWNKTQSFPEGEASAHAGGANEVSLNDETYAAAEAGPSRRTRVVSSPETPVRTRGFQPVQQELSTPVARRKSSHGPATLSARRMGDRLPSVDLSASSTPSSGPVPAHRSSPDRLSPHATEAAPSRAGASTPSGRLGWSRRAGEPRPPPLVSEDVSRRMSRWVKEVVVCNFDLETGPMVERRAGSRRWGPGEKENVAFSSFPDTSLFAEGSIIFSFKIRRIPPDPRSLMVPEPPSPMPDRSPSVGSIVIPTVEQSLLNLSLSSKANGAGAEEVLTPHTPGPPRMSEEDKAEEYRRWDERGREWLFGFVWFEQRRDKGIARGYMQKSLVILTHLPFPSLFSTVLEKVAPTFFAHGYSALEAACHSIASWPDPTSEEVLKLPIMTDFITTKLPDDNEAAQIGRAFTQSPLYPVLASLPGSTPLRAFHRFLPSLWSLWECLMLAEPILIIAPDPRTCSEIVWWLRDMMRPIPPAGDFRPYLHIHDHDLTILVNANKPQPGAVVGVTNPFFRNSAAHWPNIISIPATRPPRRSNPNGPAPTSAARPDAPEGFLSRRHRSVQKDRALLKRLEDLAADGLLDDPAGNEALRAHFQQLTEKFLVPLNRYFQTLVPNLSSPTPSAPAAPAVGRPAFKPFSLPAFLEHLRTRGPNPLAFKQRGLSTKSRVEHDFYASFCMSANFSGWLARRVESMGLAVSAHQSAAPPGGLGSTRAVPDIAPVTRPSAEMEGRGPAALERADDSYNEHARMSSEDDQSAVAYNGRVRQSEDSPREKELGDGYFGRRASLGTPDLRGLAPMTPRAR